MKVSRDRAGATVIAGEWRYRPAVPVGRSHSSGGHERTKEKVFSGRRAHTPAVSRNLQLPVQSVITNGGIPARRILKCRIASFAGPRAPADKHTASMLITGKLSRLFSLIE